jgi:hypothetical protein
MAEGGHDPKRYFWFVIAEILVDSFKVIFVGLADVEKTRKQS